MKTACNILSEQTLNGTFISALGLCCGAAEADTKVKVYLGMPHYGYQVGPDYRFREGYGWYRPVGIYRGRLSCGEARARVRHSGFRNVATVECSSRTYTFEATRRGRDITVFVNSRTEAGVAVSLDDASQSQNTKYFQISELFEGTNDSFPH